MSTIKKLQAAVAIVLATALTITLTACSSSSYGTDAFPKTSEYLFKKFSDGKYLDPYETGKGDLGSTMEAMIQLSAVGYDKSKQSKSTEWLISNSETITSAGQLGEYIFAAYVLGFSKDDSVPAALAKLRKLIKADSTIEDTNNFSFCWVIFGLLAAGDNKTANALAVKLAGYSETTGGYKYINGDQASTVSPDVTGFAMMALKATEDLGNQEDEALKLMIVNRAKSYLTTYDNSDQYWVSFGAYDISGTAYATMALTSLNVETKSYRDWLATMINKKDGGVIASWTAPDSDVFSTSQSILALNGLTYLDVLKNKVD